MILIVCVLLATPTYGAKLSVVSYNVESDGDTNPEQVAEDIANIDGSYLWGLTEVEGDSAVRHFMIGMQSARRSGKFRYFMSRSGSVRDRKDDHIAIVYDSLVLSLLETQELHFVRVNQNGGFNPGLRGTLVGRFEHKPTGKEFLFAVNHLKCCGNGITTRMRQINLFRDWAVQQDLPIIAVGDWNTPVELGSGSPVPASDFDAIVSGGVFDWVKPTNPIKTQCSAGYNSMLDHIFTRGAASTWGGSAEILFTDQAYCDREKDGTADHRPVRAVFDIPN